MFTRRALHITLFILISIAGVFAGWQTAVLGTRTPLAVGYGVAVWLLLIISAYFDVVPRRGRYIFRCPAPGCPFRVQVTGADAGEARRWQEAILAHHFPDPPR